MHYKELISKKYAELVYNGQWFSPLGKLSTPLLTKPRNGDRYRPCSSSERTLPAHRQEISV